MLDRIDKFLNNITMYRLMLYFLIVLALAGLLYSVFGYLPFDPVTYIFSFTFILSVSIAANYIFAKVFEAPTNVESVYITSLILGLIISPPQSYDQIIFIAWAGILSMAVKYIFAINRKHLFNPAAVAVLMTYFFIGNAANWWVGNFYLTPLVGLGGFLIARKLRRWDLILTFIFFTLVTTALYAILNGTDPINLIWRTVTRTPVLFFAAVMITEPLTTPPTRALRMLYAAIIGIIFTPQFHIGVYYGTPEIALSIGNIFSYLVSPKYKLLLTLREKIKLTPDTYDFIFNLGGPIKFSPGQYMEFTFDHKDPDARGNRRYFSLASSPTEPELRLGIKFGEPPSSFKRFLLTLTQRQKLVGSQLIGDFILPKDKTKKLVFIAGGIGITPFRSMLKYLADKNERRDIILIYTASDDSQFVYRDVIKEAEEKLGIKSVLVNTKKDGHIDAGKLTELVPDFSSRTYYISGSHGVVTAFESLVKSMNVPRAQIITDYFPGFV